MGTLNLADGESFVKGRSGATARELLELAGEDRKLEVRTVSHGYIVPTDILPEGYDAITNEHLPAVTTEPNTPTKVEHVYNVGGARDAEVGTPLPEADNAESISAVSTADGTDPKTGEESGTDTSGTENPEGVEYDPSKATVDEVNEYLAHADEAERTRVIEAEKAGKNRKGIVDAATPEEGK